MHHKCRNPNVIPFYGITKVPNRNEYAMGYGNKTRKICLHEMNLVIGIFIVKIFLVDEDRRILISDFGLCKPIDSTIVQEDIQGVFILLLNIAPIDFYKNDEERTSVTNDDFVDVKPLPQYDSPTDSKEKSTEPEYEYETKTFEYTTNSKEKTDKVSENSETQTLEYTTDTSLIYFFLNKKAANDDKFPDDYFYLRVGLMSHVYVLGVKRISTFFGFSNTILKTIVTSQKSESDNDVPYQLWRHENGYLINKQTNLYLDVDSDVREPVLKDGSHVVLSDSNSVSFARCNFAKWEIISLNKIINSFQDIMTQTKFIENTLDPIWSEVHYLPVKNIGDKFILDVMDFNSFTKDKPLGTLNGIDKWANLSGQGKLHYRAKFYPLTLDALPKPIENFLANLKEKPFDKSTLYILITLQTPNGSFPPSNTLANLFGYSDTEELLICIKIIIMMRES
ncbi:unnamed protein product [Rhizophagus irregularis]|nr:unnamed protein product [Rhizophagus irregularis]